MSSSKSSAAHPALDLLLPPSISSSHHPLRVTSQAKLENLVSFALGHLATPSSTPLVLHSLPAAPSTPSALPKGPITSTPLFDAAPPAPQPAPNAPKSVETSLAAIPKLVSVVEIIKREWFKVPLSSSTPEDASRPPSPSLRDPEQEKEAAEEKTREEGLHQYTLLTTLEALKVADPDRKSQRDEDDDQLELEEAELVKMEWLKGGAGSKKRPRKHHSPCMVVVLSAASLPSLSPSKGWSYQPPASSPRPKSSKRPTEGVDGAEGAGEGGKSKRRRKRRPKAKGGEEGKALAEGEKENEGMDVDEASGGDE